MLQNQRACQLIRSKNGCEPVSYTHLSIPVKSMSINLGARNALNFVKHLAQVWPGQWRKMQALRVFLSKTMHGNVAQVLRVCYN